VDPGLPPLIGKSSRSEARSAPSACVAIRLPAPNPGVGVAADRRPFVDSPSIAADGTGPYLANRLGVWWLAIVHFGVGHGSLLCRGPTLVATVVPPSPGANLRCPQRSPLPSQSTGLGKVRTPAKDARPLTRHANNLGDIRSGEGSSGQSRSGRQRNRFRCNSSRTRHALNDSHCGYREMTTLPDRPITPARCPPGATSSPGPPGRRAPPESRHGESGALATGARNSGSYRASADVPYWPSRVDEGMTNT
jgi:hypothetical protein